MSFRRPSAASYGRNHAFGYDVAVYNDNKTCKTKTYREQEIIIFIPMHIGATWRPARMRCGSHAFPIQIECSRTFAHKQEEH